jgi:hypothetical protein
MPRGGPRPNAGRKADPNSARQRKLAAKAAKGVVDRGLTAADGTKKPEAGKDWPFGRDPGTQVEPVEPKKSFATPLEFWQHVLADPDASPSAKAAAAYAMAPYVHPKIAPAAKKEEARNKAKNAAGGKFSAQRAPTLAASNGKRV